MRPQSLRHPDDAYAPITEFFDLIAVLPESLCWAWMGPLDRNDAPTFDDQDARVWAWETLPMLMGGRSRVAPEGLGPCPRLPSCVNPEHAET